MAGSAALRLDDKDRAALAGEAGEAAAFAMDVLTRFATAVGAQRLLDIVGAHVDGCLYHGAVSLDFVERLVAGGGRVLVPTSLNVGSMDLIHPGLVRTQEPERAAGRRLMEAHLSLGCAPTFTCAPYQTAARPRFGDQIAWGESNAIVFANSVLGARTNRYGDFIDLCCAIAGRAPAFGLHLDANRRAEVVFALPEAVRRAAPNDALYVAVGALVGGRAGTRVPAIVGLPPPPTEDQLKALGAVAASKGAVGLFHAVGITPEAPSLAAALAGRPAAETVAVAEDDLDAALGELSTAPPGTPLAAVSLGTPHFSRAEWEGLLARLPGFRPAAGVEVYVNTGRETLAGLAADGLLPRLAAAGITALTDTCTYVTAVLDPRAGAVMTNSGKFAHYAPGNLGVEVAFGDLETCLLSAREGRVARRPSWRG